MCSDRLFVVEADLRLPKATGLAGFKSPLFSRKGGLVKQEFSGVSTDNGELSVLENNPHASAVV